MNTSRFILTFFILACLSSYAEVSKPGILPPAKDIVLEVSKKTQWTSSDGRILKAKLLSIHENTAQMELSSGKPINVSVERFSEADKSLLTEAAPLFPKKWPGWPNMVSMELSDVKVRTKKTEDYHIYQTKNFEFKSEIPLDQKLRIQIGRTFELTYKLMEKSPWGIMATPKNGLFRAELYENESNYYAAGGIPNSAGTYSLKRKVFMVPLDSLGRDKFEKSELRHTLIHELTHMLMDDCLKFLPLTVTEGIAEYMSRIPYRSGIFRPLTQKEKHKSLDLNSASLLFLPEAQASIEASQYQESFLIIYAVMNDKKTNGALRIRQMIGRSLQKTPLFEKEIERYNAEIESYNATIHEHNKVWTRYTKKLNKFKETHDIETRPDGTFSYPSHLTPPTPPVAREQPKAPEVPFNGQTFSQLQLTDLPILTDGVPLRSFLSRCNTILSEE